MQTQHQGHMAARRELYPISFRPAGARRQADSRGDANWPLWHATWFAALVSLLLWGLVAAALYRLFA